MLAPAPLPPFRNTNGACYERGCRRLHLLPVTPSVTLPQLMPQCSTGLSLSAHNGLHSGRIAITLGQERGKIMGIVLVYLPEFRPGLPKHIKTHVARNEILQERSPFLERVTYFDNFVMSDYRNVTYTVIRPEYLIPRIYHIIPLFTCIKSMIFPVNIPIILTMLMVMYAQLALQISILVPSCTGTVVPCSCCILGLPRHVQRGCSLSVKCSHCEVHRS